jgi:hypothetical protein
MTAVSPSTTAGGADASADAAPPDQPKGTTGGLRFWWRCLLLAGLALILLALTWWDGHRAAIQLGSAGGSRPTFVVSLHD